MITVEPNTENMISHTIGYRHDYVEQNRKNLEPGIDGLKRKQV